MCNETFFVLALARDLSRAHRAQLKGFAPEVIEVNLMKGHQRDPKFREVNPMMAMPALIDGDGPALFESLAIIEYLDETHPKPPLLPKDPKARARVRGLAQIVAADSHPLIVPRVREYLAHEFKVDEAGVMKWAQHWHKAALDGAGGASRRPRRRPALIARASRSPSPTFVSPARWRARIFSRSIWRRSRPSSASSTTCIKNDAFARAHPLKQPGAPAAA